MTRFKSIPISASAAERIRHGEAEEVIASENPGYPCRVCLQDAQVGERLLLGTFGPFERPSPFRTEGPVYIHAEPCTPWAGDAGIPTLLRSRLLALRAYDERDHLTDAQVVHGSDADAEIERFLADPKTKTLHVHFARPGCFACRVERS